jgi:hypothetical protein
MMSFANNSVGILKFLMIDGRSGFSNAICRSSGESSENAGSGRVNVRKPD